MTTTDTWTCECGNVNTGDSCARSTCGKERPVELSEEERDAWEAYCRACSEAGWDKPDHNGSTTSVGHKAFRISFLVTARAPIVEKLRQAEERHAREVAELQIGNEHALQRIAELEAKLAEAAKRVPSLTDSERSAVVATWMKRHRGAAESDLGWALHNLACDVLRAVKDSASGILLDLDADAAKPATPTRTVTIPPLAEGESHTVVVGQPAASPAEVTLVNVEKATQYQPFASTCLAHLRNAIEADIRANLARAEERHRSEMAREREKSKELFMLWKQADGHKREAKAEVERLTRERDAKEAPVKPFEPCDFVPPGRDGGYARSRCQKHKGHPGPCGNLGWEYDRNAGKQPEDPSYTARDLCPESMDAGGQLEYCCLEAGHSGEHRTKGNVGFC